MPRRHGRVHPANFFDGIIGEFWYADADIQRGAAASVALSDEVFKRIAWEGPFTYPDIAANIMEYRSLRKGPEFAREVFGDNYWRVTRQTWGLSATPPIIGPHPPLYSEYETRIQGKADLLV